jgi:periplasmic divalent cation tolerance protein
MNMPEDHDFGIVLCACPNDDHADRLARALVEHKLAACVQVSPIKSFYEWKGEICRDDERLLIIKSKTVLYHDLEEFIVKNHPYEIPEIIMVPISRGLGKYFTWIDSVCRK